MEDAKNDHYTEGEHENDHFTEGEQDKEYIN